MDPLFHKSSNQLVRFLAHAGFALVTLFVLIFVVTSFVGPTQKILGAGTPPTGEFGGYAWSDNIGWVSFNCLDNPPCNGSTNSYKVSLSSLTGKLTGYAWSDNVGWVSFTESDLLGCPQAPCNARLVGGSIFGWARVLSYGGGWDGWISLYATTSPNYGVTISGTNVLGYAWGSVVVGALKMDAIFGGSTGVQFGGGVIPTINFTATPPQVIKGNSVDLSWSTNDAALCISSGGNPGDNWVSSNKGISGNQTINNMNADATYTLSCGNAIGTTTSNVFVDVLTPDFSLTKTNDIGIKVTQLNSSTSTIRVTPLYGFNSAVQLSASPATIGGISVTYDFSDNALNNNEYNTGSIISITADDYIPKGQYTITVTGTGASLTHTIPLMLNVTSGPRYREE